MLIDHIGILFFPNVFLLRIIGRLSLPIFSFFIAEGFYHTKNKTNYILRLLVVAIISQIPFVFIGMYLELNILFTFVVSLLIIVIVNKFFKSKKWFLILSGVFLVCGLLFASHFCDYKLMGILIVLNFYYLRERKYLKFVTFIVIVLAFTFIEIIINKNYGDFMAYRQLFSLLSILLLFPYNNNVVYPNKLKFIFYIFYPLHLFILGFIKIITML